MAFTIITPTDEALRFIDEWNNGKDFVEAHTSGSTGMPKTVRLLKSDMLKSAQATIDRFGLNETSRLFSPLSADYIAGKMMLVRAIAANCAIVTETPSNTPMQHDCGNIDLMAVVPSQCASLAVNDIGAKRLKNLIVGGAPMTSGTEMQMMSMPWQTFATYGMTETCSHVALREVGNELFDAMPGIIFSTDKRGCLEILTDGFSFGKLQTNDVVELHGSHSFRWLGRHDNVINSGGVKFFPEQLEKALEGTMPHPFYFKGMPDPVWGETVAMVVEFVPADSAEADAMRDRIVTLCRCHLPRYANPRHIIFKPSLPRTSNGKLRRI